MKHLRKSQGVQNFDQRMRQLEKPKLGTLKNKVIAHDRDWWKPMTEEETDTFIEGQDSHERYQGRE